MKKISFWMTIALLGILTPAGAQGLRNGPINTGQTVSVQGGGENPQFHLQQAELHMQSLNFERALMELDNAIEYNPYRADAYVSRALVKYRIGMRAEAARDIEIANRLNPYATDLYGYNGADNQLRLLAFDPAPVFLPRNTDLNLRYYLEELDEEYAELSARDTGGLSALALDYLEQAILLLEADRYESALAELSALEALYPRVAVAHDLRGVIYLKQGLLSEAEAAFRMAIDMDPDFAIAWYNLGRVLQEQGKQQEALAFFDQAVALEQDLTSVYFDRATARKATGDQEGALADYSRAMEATGVSQMEALRNRGLTRKMLGDFAGALADFNQLVAEHPDDPNLRKNRGNLYLLYGYYDRALADYTEAIALKSDFAEAYYNRGIAHLLNYDYVSACADLVASAELGYTRAREKWSYFCAN